MIDLVKDGGTLLFSLNGRILARVRRNEIIIPRDAIQHDEAKHSLNTDFKIWDLPLKVFRRKGIYRVRELNARKSFPLSSGIVIHYTGYGGNFKETTH